MKALIVALLAPALAHAQYVVTTVAGGAPATSGLGGGIARDAAGNTYLCNNTIISRIGSDGKIVTYAGTGLAGYSGDGGSALSAQLDGASLCVIDGASNLIVADIFNMRIRRIDQAGNIATIVGTGVSGPLGDGGPGLAAQIGYVSGLAADAKGNVYFSDSTNVTIRRLDVSGTVKLIAGNTAATSPGDGGPAIAALLLGPKDVANDAAGNIYFVDGNIIRRIAPNGIISTVAGSRSGTNSVMDGQPATSGGLAAIIAGFTSDSTGDLYIADGTFIRRVDAQTGIISTIAGTATFSASLEGPALSTSIRNTTNLYVDRDGVLWLSTTRLRTLSNGTITTIATPSNLSTPDGMLAKGASLRPTALAVTASGDIYIGEGNTCAIRKIGSDGRLSTVPGTGNCNAKTFIAPESIVVDSHGTVYSSTDGNVYAISPSGEISTVNGLRGGFLTIDSHDRIYETQRGNSTILRLAPDGSIQTLVGSIILSFTGGDLRQASLVATALDSSDNLYVVASSMFNPGPALLFRLDPNGLTPIPGIYASEPQTLAVDRKGNFWMGDSSEFLGVGAGFRYVPIRATAIVDGPLLSATFGGVPVLQTGPDGSIYGLDLGCSCVRKITGAPPPKAPSISAAGIVNAASLTPGPVALGELVSIFGANLGPSEVESFTLSNNAIPPVLDDVEVLINGIAIPITAVSANQINAFVPYSVFGYIGPTATFTVNAHGAPSQAIPLSVVSSAFGLFTADGSGSGQGAILNQDGSYNNASNPAPVGTIVSLFGTGEGGITPATPAGSTVISTPFPSIAAPVSVTVGGRPASVAYSGAAPFQPGGIDQINITIPAGTPPGAAAIVVNVGNSTTTKTVIVAVK